MAKQEFYKPKKTAKSVSDDEQKLGGAQGLDLARDSGRLDTARSTSQQANETLSNIDEVLAAQEKNPDGNRPDPDQAEQEETERLSENTGVNPGRSSRQGSSPANDDADWKTSVGDKSKKPGLLKRFSTARKLWLGGGAAVLAISSLFAFFAFISPYKAEAIIKSIESRVGEVPQNAVDHRLEFYMARYLMLRAAEKADTNFEKNRSYTYIGNGVFKTLYTNWKGAKLEATLEKNYKIRISPVKPVGNLIGRDLIKPTEWRVEYLDQIDRKTGKPRVETMQAPEFRKALGQFTDAELKSGQVVKRLGYRWVLKKFYGVNNWKPFERTQNNAKDKYREKKATFKKFMVKQTVGRISGNYSNYLSCLIDGGDRCKEENLNPPKERVGDLDTDMDKAIDESKDHNDKNFLTKKLQEIGMKRIITGMAAGVGFGLAVLELMGGIQGAVENGSLSHVTYDSLSQQYAGYSTAIQSASDQIRAGDDFDIEDPRVLAETFSGFEASPVYNAVNNATGPYVRDCDGDGTNDTTLKPGEYVCSNRRLIQDREAIVKDSIFWPVINALGTFYNSTLKGISDWFGDIFSSVFDALGVNALFEKIMEVTGLAKEMAKYVQMAIQWAVGFSLTGDEEGVDAYDATYAGITVRNSVYGSTIGGDREGTIGGAPLTDEQVGAIFAEQEEYEQYALSKKSIFERYFSPDVDKSITSYAIMHTPVTVTSMSTSFLQAVNPVSIVSKFGAIMTTRTDAVTPKGTVANPFHGINYGYANNSPALDMEEDELNETYQCNLPAAERPQNKAMGRPNGIPFDIYTQADPCLLNKEVGRIGNGYVTGNFNELSGD